MITRLDYRMDDIVAASQSAAHREVRTRFLNLSSGAGHAAPALVGLQPQAMQRTNTPLEV